MKIINLNPVSDKRWLEFVENKRESSMFYHPSWINVLQKQYKFKPFAICTEDKFKRISNGIPFCEVTGITGIKKWISLPFSDHCPIIAGNNEELASLLNFITNDASLKKIKSIEIRSKLSENSQFEQKPVAYIHTISLEKMIEEVLGSFNKSRIMRGIKKSQKESVGYFISYSISDLNMFYLLHTKTRKKLGIPVQPKKFFTQLYMEIIEKKLGFICIAKKDLIPLAAGIFAGSGETMTYKYGASDPSMLHLKPNHLMFLGAILEAHRNGFKYFDFGKTDYKNEGLREFKSGWGTIQSDIYYSYFPNAPQNKILNIFKNSFFSLIIKKSPAFVCRLSGELFYKYLA